MEEFEKLLAESFQSDLLPAEGAAAGESADISRDSEPATQSSGDTGTSTEELSDREHHDSDHNSGANDLTVATQDEREPAPAGTEQE